MTFEGFDPIYVKVKWKNNKIPEDTYVYCIVLFAIYYQGKWSLVTFTFNNEQYVWGVHISAYAPSAGEVRTEPLTSYVLNFDKEYSAGCLVYIIKGAVTLKECYVNWGHGSRAIGIKVDDLNKLFNAVDPYGAKLFKNMFTVKPYKPPAEIKSCKVSKE